MKEIIYNEAKVKSKNLDNNCALQLGKYIFYINPKKILLLASYDSTQI